MRGDSSQSSAYNPCSSQAESHEQLQQLTSRAMHATTSYSAHPQAYLPEQIFKVLGFAVESPICKSTIAEPHQALEQTSHAFQHPPWIKQISVVYTLIAQ